MTQEVLSKKTKALGGSIQIPGDKSISHRALILSGLANGQSHITGLLEGADVMATATIMRALGADIQKQGAGDYIVQGVGLEGLKNPETSLDCGNSGTSMRLISGLVAGAGLSATLTGDESLSRRPMRRIIDPLRKMGAVIKGNEQSCPPLQIGAAKLSPIQYRIPVASAQVKSCLMLAGLFCEGKTVLVEPTPTRDHTESMLGAFGVQLDLNEHEDGRHIAFMGKQDLQACDITVPSDPSSAAFFIVAGLIVPESELHLPGIMMNPTRTGLITTLLEMGANIEINNERLQGGEIVADLVVRSSALKGITVPANRSASMIDEYPILCIAAAFANGTTTMVGLGELRVKETDRLAAMEAGLRQCGVACTTTRDSITITGMDQVEGSPTQPIATFHDHRIAMSFYVLGLASENGCLIDDASMIKTSFPNFLPLMQDIDAHDQTPASFERTGS